jgi:hypothetical protein
MSRKKAEPYSAADMFWAFVQDNPKLATTLAFELGSLAGTAVRNSSGAKKYIKSGAKKVPQALAHVVPEAVASALKFLPAPNIQPRKPARRATTRKTKPVTE